MLLVTARSKTDFLGGWARLYGQQCIHLMGRRGLSTPPPPKFPQCSQPLWRLSSAFGVFKFVIFGRFLQNVHHLLSDINRSFFNRSCLIQFSIIAVGEELPQKLSSIMTLITARSCKYEIARCNIYFLLYAKKINGRRLRKFRMRECSSTG